MTTPKPLRLVVAINPSASFGKSRAVGPAVVQTLRAAGHEVTALTEPDFEELQDAARAALRGKPDALVVVGGDGMVSLGVNLLAGTKIPLGIVPSGTGNDMARGLGIPVGNTEAAIEMLLAALRQPPRVIDAGRVTRGRRHGRPGSPACSRPASTRSSTSAPTSCAGPAAGAATTWRCCASSPC